MASFESIDRLRHRPRTLPPQFFAGAALSCHEKTQKKRRQPAEPAVTRGKIQDLTHDTGATRQLARAQRMEAISRVTGGIAHNFNNLLTGIMGFCDLLADGSRDRDADGRYLENIMDAAQHGGDLVKQLLAFSQQQVLEPETFDMNRAVTDCETLLRRMAGEDVEVDFDLETASGSVRADPKQIEQVISNLAANAVEAMAEGGRLALRTRHLELDDISISHLGIPQGSYVLLEVEDTGAGIDEAIYDRIFEPFFSTKKQLNSTGLGLSMVYGIVKQSGGQIRVESSPGFGSCFRVYLPRTDPRQEFASGSTAVPASAAASDSTPAAEPPERRQTILLAEDDPKIQLALKTFLIRRGYEVLPASDGAEGIELSGRHDGEIDLLLTDIVMPRVDGLELAQRMLAARADTKVLFISGFAQEREALCELLGGSTDVGFLKKPFENESLELKLHEMLDPEPSRLDGRRAAA